MTDPTPSDQSGPAADGGPDQARAVIEQVMAGIREALRTAQAEGRDQDAQVLREQLRAATADRMGLDELTGTQVSELIARYQALHRELTAPE
ncbi:hypothetical protein ACEZDB_36045 [Streptacidiphilus sp. N1-3]|uniref:Uncharacterized protein n=1 Tax=Streptacidiphilus alkalitolerans TaxID=3342712 RepID=A0ABV6XCR9_9ACTN